MHPNRTRLQHLLRLGTGALILLLVPPPMPPR